MKTKLAAGIQLLLLVAAVGCDGRTPVGLSKLGTGGGGTLGTGGGGALGTGGGGALGTGGGGGPPDAATFNPTPRLVVLQGTASLTPGSYSRTETHPLYLPAGWEPGAAAWFDFEPFSFDANGGTADLCAGGGCPHSFVPLDTTAIGGGWGLHLDPGDGCAHFHYDQATFRISSDVIGFLSGDLVACPTASAWPATATAGATMETAGVLLGAALPMSAIVVDLTAPIDESTVGNATLRVDGAQVAAVVSQPPGQIVLTPAAPIPLGAVAAASLDGLRDVMGRPFSSPPPLVGLATSATVGDLTLAVAPPAGAVAALGTSPSFTTGTGLCVTDAGHYPRDPFAVVIALGDVSGTTVQVSFTASSRYSAYTGIAVARSDGSAGAAGVLRPGASPLDLPVPPGTGPISLLISNANLVPVPDDMASPTVFCIESIAVR